MNYRQAMLDILAGAPPARPVLVPRLDIWHNANRARGTLPPGFEGLSPRQCAKLLGVGLHSVVPDFIRTGDERDIHHRALGFHNHPDFPWRADFSRVDHSVEKAGGELKVTYFATHGEITTRINHPEGLLASGATIPDILEPAAKSPADLPLLADLLSRVEIVPAPEAYRQYHGRIGDDGLAVAFMSLACGPALHTLRDLMRMEDFFLATYDAPDALDALYEPLAVLHDKIIDATVASDAEAALFGANYDASVTSPPFFDQRVAPWLRKAAAKLRGRGKYLLTHADGENRGLLGALLDSGVDVADSVCPAPMTKLSVAEYRRAFAGRISIWGGIPSVVMLKASCPDAAFRAHLDAFLAACRPFDHLLVSVADTAPPDMDFDRFLRLRDRCLGV